jgi:hypothetical protein
MDPILDAIEAIGSREDGASFAYREVANKFGVNRTTLSWRHRGVQGSSEEIGKAQQLLNPQQEIRTRAIYRKMHKARLAT